MKTRTVIATVVSLLATVCFLAAKDTDRDFPILENRVHINKETRILHKLLSMDDAELAKLRQTVERIEKMSPEERAQLRARIGEFSTMPPEAVERLRKNFRAIPKEQREAMRARWMEMSPQERAEQRARVRAMSPEEREIFFEERGFLPPLPGHTINTTANKSEEEL